MTTVTLYSKPGCHLCEAVEQVIVPVQKRIPFQLVVRNILEDEHDHKIYRDLIPVVHVNGQEIARYRMTEDQLVAALQANSPVV